jgi:hypothetical protein
LRSYCENKKRTRKSDINIKQNSFRMELFSYILNSRR